MAKQKISLKELVKAAKRGMKSGPKKYRYAGYICFAVCAALIVWWIVTVVQLVG